MCDIISSSVSGCIYLGAIMQMYVGPNMSLRAVIHIGITYMYVCSCEGGVHQWSGRLGFNPRSSHTKDS